MAKDALGNDVTVDGWLSTHLPGDRSLVQVGELDCIFHGMNAEIVVAPLWAASETKPGHT